MTGLSADRVRDAIVRTLAPVLARMGIAAQDVGEGFDLRGEGVVDSLGFLELLTRLEEQLGVAVDLEGLDVERLTIVGALSRHIAERNGTGAAGS